MTEEQVEEQPRQLGPAKISFPLLLLKTLAGVAGGAIGSLVLLLIFVVASSMLNPLINPAESTGVSPVFVFLLLIMVFFASTGGNLLSVLFLSLTEREKYQKTPTAIYHIFIISVIMFLLMVPVYFIAASIKIDLVVFVVGLHIILAAMASAMVLEIVSNHKYALLGLYGIIFSIIVTSAILFGLYGAVSTGAVVVFVALPIVWGVMSFIYSAFCMIYGWIVDLYDKDFLSMETEYGNDYGKAVESDKPKTPRAKDEAGAEFLRHNN